MSYLKSIGKYLFFLSLPCFALLGFILFCNYYIESNTESKLYNQLDNMPSNKVGLVLGAVKTLPSGYPNRYFKYRIQAAYDLYKSGKVEYLLVSGDNHTKGYNEPEDMRNDLIAMGVPADKIYMDYAGFRTLDSVVRCSEIFGQDKFTIVSQKFHNERAVFIGEKKGLDLIAYNANAVGRRNFPIINVDRNQLRELLAKTKAVLDLYILNKQPRFSGKKIVIGKDPVVLG